MFESLRVLSLSRGSRWTLSGVPLLPWCSFAGQISGTNWASVSRTALWVWQIATTYTNKKTVLCTVFNYHHLEFHVRKRELRIVPLTLCMQICSLMRGGIAERGGVRVGHRIIEINSQSVVATPHEKIVQILSNAMGEVGAALSLWEIKMNIKVQKFESKLRVWYIQLSHAFNSSP